MKRLIQLILASSFIFTAILVTNKIRFHYSWKDAFCRTLLTPFLGTVWAEGFSEVAFAKVRLGMQESDVEVLVGKPVRKNCGDDACLWSYADQDPDSAPYDRRWVSFNANHRVIEVRHEFYID